jgi:hypothetical protein
VVLPDGDGKPIATEFCQDCHRLTNLARAHKELDEWKDTIHTMMERGARIPDEKVDTLAQYLFANFGPKAARTRRRRGGTSLSRTGLRGPVSGDSIRKRGAAGGQQRARHGGTARR